MQQKKNPRLVEVKLAQFLMLSGQGDPSGDGFQVAVGAMYSVAFAAKMTKKKEEGLDYKVCQLEGQWWAEGSTYDFIDQPRDSWKYNLMIRVPDFITAADVQKAIETASQKGKEGVEKVSLETYEEGLCVQALHLGSYAEETPLIRKIEDFARENGKIFHGLHHEIYLSDARRVAPEKLKTILRHPIIDVD
ncbi:MAG: GyrI-like domain-containing protein [Candidatus Electryonea clarkiae]|nr:GyrI-like domain-containing protein [Candidatus Electryonea clarkiae]